MITVEKARGLLHDHEVKDVTVIRHGSGLIKFLIETSERQQTVDKLKLIFPDIITDESFGITNLYHK
jgi:hypothetical protein